MTDPVREVRPTTARGPLGAWIACGLAVVAFVIYAQCLGFGLVWDDPVVLDAQLPRIDSLARAFVPPPDLPGMSGSYYRPLVWLSYRADDAIAGRPADPARRRRTQALVFHATSVVLHAAASALVFLFGAQLLRRTWRDELALVAAVAGGLLFAVHPVHVDSVAAIAGRSDSLCAVFGLLSLLCFVRHAHGGGAPALAGVAGFTLCALLSKEAGAGLFLVFAAIEFLPGASGARTRAARWLVLAAVAAVYALLRFGGLRGLETGADSVIPGEANTLPALGWYALKVLWPPPQSPYAPRVAGAFAILGAAVLLGLAVVLVLARRRSSWRAGLALGALSVGTLAPALMLTVVGASYLPVAERYLYFPTVGVCLLLGMLVARVGESLAARSGRRPIAAATALVAALLAIPAAWISVQHSRTWRDEVSLWSLVVGRTPDAGPPRVQLGLALAVAGRYDEAEASLRRAVALFADPRDQARALSNLGSVLHAARKFEPAIVELERALDADPGHWPARFNLGVVLLDLADRTPIETSRRARVDAAIVQLEQVVAAQPRHAGAQLQLGLAWLRLGRADLARQQLLEVQKIAPDSPEARAAAAALATPG